MWLGFLLGLGAVLSADAAGAGAARLICYVEDARNYDYTECTHLVYTGTARGDKLDGILNDYRKHNPKLKIVLRVADDDKDLKDILKSKYVQGIEIYNAHQSFNRTKVSELVEDAKAAVSSANKGPLLLALPAHPELLAKYYDLRTLVKKADLMMVQTHALGTVKKMTYHPSRLSGLWDMMNTDSVVDLVIGLGVPASKIVVSLPATARQFTLKNETLSTPGSPTVEDEPREIDQAQLCRLLQKGRWTLERDQDLSAPYAFQNSTWISFEDFSSVDVKGKYARVRGLAGLALYRADKDSETSCGGSLRSILHKVLNQQSRAPRAAVLRSLENEILSAGPGRALDALQVSPYRITQVVDSDGVIHSIREDTRTEFSCSRQGYFVHPRSCARFYRCVKFDQYSPDFTVFEFDCPVGLAFDARYEVCVWPGSLPDSTACPGSAEIAPVPRSRFVCPQEEGFYVDPENCRWFFACLDHGKSPLTAYEFRCPFGLGFDAARLRCDWPWLVPDCGNIGRYEAEAFGFSAATLTGATGFQGRTADSVNIAAHQSLASGAALDNLVGIQKGFLGKQDILDSNFIAAQEADDFGNYQIDYTNLGSQGEPSGLSYKVVAADAINKGLVQATKYDDDDKYTSGSIILDDYRLPTNKATGYNGNSKANIRYDSGKYTANNAYSYTNSQIPPSLRTGQYRKDNRGKYVHNPIGDRAKPYQHIEVPPVPYEHIDFINKNINNFDRDTYSGSYDKVTYSGTYNTGSYEGAYDTSSNNQATSQSGGYDYPRPNISFKEGIAINENKEEYGSGSGATNGQSTTSYHGTYGGSSIGSYVTETNIHSGAPHILTAGAINVDLVGKTTLVDDFNYYNQGNEQQAHDIAQQAVSITHVGTDAKNFDGYSFVTTPTSSGIPTTATPFAVTTSLPGTYKTEYVPQAPKTSIKQIFGYTQQPVTYVQPTIVAITPSIETVEFNQSNAQNNGYSTYTTDTYNSKPTGYDYSKPNIKFEEGTTYSTTPATIKVTKLRPQSFSHNQETLHTHTGSVAYSTPVTEEPFKKVIAYTTGTPITFSQPTAQTFSQQSVNKFVAGDIYAQNLDNLKNTVSSTSYTNSAPQTISIVPSIETAHITQHVVAANNINNPQTQLNYQYVQPTSTSYIQSGGYDYRQPNVRYDIENQENNLQIKTIESQVPSTTAQPSVTPSKTTYENPFLKYTTNVTPASYQETYAPQVFNQQINYRGSGYQYTPAAKPVLVQSTHFYNENIQDVKSGYDYSKPSINFEESVATSSPVSISTERPQSYKQQNIYRGRNFASGYQHASISQPSVSVEPASTIEFKGHETPFVEITERPQAYSQQTIHRGSSQINSKTGNYRGYDHNEPQYETGYEYSQPIRFKQVEIVSTTPVPAPDGISQQTFYRSEIEKERIASTVQPQVQSTHQAPAVSVYENPFLGFSQKALEGEINQPLQLESGQQVFSKNNLAVKQVFSYDQPEIQRNVEISRAPAYSDASIVSHQVFHQSQILNKNSGKDVVFVSTTPSTLLYENHYAEYETPSQVDLNSKYIQPKSREYNTDSNTQKHIDSHSTYNVPAEVEPQYISSISTSSQIKQTRFESPEIQVAYNAEEYLPPVKSTTVRPKLAPTYRPITSTTPREYLPPVSSTYLPPQTETIKTLEYLPPTQKSASRVITYETFGYDAGSGASNENRLNYQQSYSSPTQESTTETLQRKQNLVVETAKSNLLGFGTVGPDAGLVSTYTTLRPTLHTDGTVFVGNGASSTLFTPEVDEVATTRKPRPKYFRPAIKSTTQAPTYVESTSYQAPEYLPPDNVEAEINNYGYKYDNSAQNEYNPYQSTIADITHTVSSTPVPTRTQNIVVETAKSNLAFEKFNSEGYSSTASTTTPVTSTYETEKQELVEITSTQAPFRRARPKVAVVTKINDFNPLLVRKLGAVCSCQSPILILKGRRPTTQTQIIEDYSSDDDSNTQELYEGSRRKNSYRITTPVVNTVTTVTPTRTSTYNPIIVPDDSYYQDYQDASNDNVVITSTGKSRSENYISSTQAPSTTERVVRIRPRVKAVTIAPTYKTIALRQEVAPEESDGPDTINVEPQTFDRYGPGGWRSRDETLQGSIDCKRAGLFRHPKQCNKFYACRWDCTKQRFTLHVFNCPVQLSFDPNLGACNWPSQGPACQGDTLLTNTL